MPSGRKVENGEATKPEPCNGSGFRIAEWQLFVALVIWTPMDHGPHHASDGWFNLPPVTADDSTNSTHDYCDVTPTTPDLLAQIHP
jgi:hypothetical protein